MPVLPGKRSALRRRRGERGAVIVEFVMVFCLYLAVVAIGASLGKVIDTRLKLTTMAFFVGRACAFQYPLADPSGMEQCASDVLKVATGVWNMPDFCRSPTLAVSQTGDLPSPPAPARLQVLTVRLSCSYDDSKASDTNPEFSLLRTMKQSGLFGLSALDLGDKLLAAQIAMPYMRPGTLPNP